MVTLKCLLLPHFMAILMAILMAPMVTNGDSGNIGDNDDPLETMMIYWSYNGTNGDNIANGDNGIIDSSGVIGANGTIEW